MEERRPAHRTAHPAAGPVLLAATILLVTVNSAWALKCYSCSELPKQVNPNATEQLCANFDASWRYVVDCPHSTFCRKTSVELALPHGKSIQTVKRDCAPQLDQFQTLENRTWQKKNETVTSIYNEGCSKDDGQQATNAEYCYCQSYLCNSSKSSYDSSYSHHSDAMAVIFVFNAMKYLRSLR